MLTQKRYGAHFSRRTLIAGAATLPFSFSLARGLQAANSDDSPGLVMREREPQNLESDFTALAAITPNSRFYVRNHFPVPELDDKVVDAADRRGSHESVAVELRRANSDAVGDPTRYVGVRGEWARSWC